MTVSKWELFEWHTHTHAFIHAHHSIAFHIVQVRLGAKWGHFDYSSIKWTTSKQIHLILVASEESALVLRNKKLVSCKICKPNCEMDWAEFFFFPFCNCKLVVSQSFIKQWLILTIQVEFFFFLTIRRYNKVGSNPGRECLLVLPVQALVFSGYSDFLPQSKKDYYLNNLLGNKLFKTLYQSADLANQFFVSPSI